MKLLQNTAASAAITVLTNCHSPASKIPRCLPSLRCGLASEAEHPQKMCAAETEEIFNVLEFKGRVLMVFKCTFANRKISRLPPL